MLVAMYKSSRRHTHEHSSLQYANLSVVMCGRNIRKRKEYISYLQIIEKPGVQLVSRATTWHFSWIRTFLHTEVKTQNKYSNGEVVCTLNWHINMKTYENEVVQLHALLMSALHWGQRLVSHPKRLTLQKSRDWVSPSPDLTVTRNRKLFFAPTGNRSYKSQHRRKDNKRVTCFVWV